MSKYLSQAHTFLLQVRQLSGTQKRKRAALRKHARQIRNAVQEGIPLEHVSDATSAIVFCKIALQEFSEE